VGRPASLQPRNAGRGVPLARCADAPAVMVPMA
jgi:hypothetical protein